MRERQASGFTLIELLIVIAIIGVLITIGSAKWVTMSMKAKESATKGALGTLRSALSVYYGDNENTFPHDNLSCLIIGSRYIPAIPPTNIPPVHDPNTAVRAESTVTELGGWSYNNDSSDRNWGRLVVGCLHSDTRGSVWSTY